MPQPDEERFEIVFTGLVDHTPVEEDVIDHQLLSSDEVGKIEAERGHIAREFFRSLFERETYAGLIKLRRATDKELQSEHCLTATCSSANERGPTLRETTDRDLVQAVN